MEEVINGLDFELLKGDITSQPKFEAVVNAANARLKPGGGVAGAIHRAAGPELEKECRPLAPIKPGEAVITNAYSLPNKRVIHTLGPVYGRDEPSDKILAECYRNSLDLADEEGLSSIAFPAISTGAFGYPMKQAARISIKTISNKIKGLTNVKKVGLVLHSTKAFDIHKKEAKNILKR